MANTRTESHIPRGVTLLLVAAGDHLMRLLELFQPDDGIQIDVVDPGPSASAAVSAQQYSLYLIDETAASDLGRFQAHNDGHPARPVLLLTADAPEPQLSLEGDSVIHLLPWNLLNRASLTIAIGSALRWHAAAETRAAGEHELKFHLDSLPYPTTVWRKAGADLRLTAVNRAAQTLTDGRLGAMVGRLAGDIFGHRPDIVAVMRNCLETGCTRRYEGPFLMRTKNEERYLIKTYAFVPPDIVIGHTEDITERKRAEAALVEREREFHALFEHAKDAILITDSDARFVNANPSALTLLGVDLERLRTMQVSDVSVVDAGCKDVWAQFLTAGYAEGRIRVRRSDGALRTVDYAATAHFAPGRHLSILRDVTDRVELERELQHVQRLDSVGRLAGGIAHDFNNLLTAILGFADLLLATFPADDPRRDDMREVQRAAQSAAALTRQLLAFSRKQVLQAVVFDLNDHIAGVTGLLRRLLGDAIVVTTRCKVRRLRITADPTQLEQILLNLCINARDAMPIGGSLEIATDRVTFDAGTVRDGVTIVPGAYARLVVSDTGHGMSADTLAHLFEPFFTTKSRGNGTGLGLATVYGIVKQSGGYIWASSEIGTGSSFELIFPESTTAASSAPFEDDGTEPDPEVEPATVLVVDDDRAVRALIVRTLEREGFTVVQASSTTEAIHHFNPSVAMLVTDIVMPSMSGVTLARTLLARRPDLKVLLMSGYPPDSLDQYGSLPGSGEVLAKPFAPDALLCRVLGALGRHAG